MSSVIDLEPMRTWTRAEYDQLVELGVFDGEHIELIAGRLVQMSPEGPRHAAVISRVLRLLFRALDDRATIRPGNPRAVSDTSEPEPDLAVGAHDSFSDLHHPASALPAIEVAHSSLRKDSFAKPALYAGAGVPEYWTVDLAADNVRVLRDPIAGGYASAATYGAGQSITLVAFPDVTIEVDDILGG
jgi:Uma2 family endonuclease